MGCLLSRLAGAGCWLKTLLTGLTSLIGFVGDGFVSTHSVAEIGVQVGGVIRVGRALPSVATKPPVWCSHASCECGVSSLPLLLSMTCGPSKGSLKSALGAPLSGPSGSLPQRNTMRTMPSTCRIDCWVVAVVVRPLAGRLAYEPELSGSAAPSESALRIRRSFASIVLRTWSSSCSSSGNRSV